LRENIIERRYFGGISNLLNLYIPLVDSWRIYDNEGNTPELIASGDFNGIRVVNEDIYRRINV
jgi:predicted ABC-type ATPase